MQLMSERSKQALSDAFFRAARSGLLRSSEDVLEVQQVPQRRSVGTPGEMVLVITTSSFAFRLLTLFHVASTPESRAYYGAAPDAKMETAFAETLNLFCGALNRELVHDFPHLGISIPYALSAECLGCLDELKPEHVCRYGITVNGSIRLEATLCICCSAPVALANRLQEVAETTGELELF